MAKLQVELQARMSWLFGDIGACGSKGAPREAKDKTGKTIAEACLLPHASAWSACSRRRARWANREAGGSLGTTWLWGKGGRAVFARCHPTNYSIHPRKDDESTKHSFEDHLKTSYTKDRVTVLSCQSSTYLSRGSGWRG